MGTPFIIIVLIVIVVCIAMATAVAGLMRKNGGMAGEESEPTGTPPSLEASERPSPTGPLPAFMPLPHQTQPLSEIYYYDEQLSGPLPAIPPPPPMHPGTPGTPPRPAQLVPAEASPPIMPPARQPNQSSPSGPLPNSSGQ